MFAIPVSEAQVWIFQAFALAFVALVLLAMSRRRDETGARTETRSRKGIVVQGFSFALVSLGPVKATLSGSSLSGLSGLAAVLLFMSCTIGLFGWSSSALGRNWSLKARMLSDHELVRTGPYAHVRHPIYLAMLFFLLAMAVALGHWLQLVAAVPVFLLGTNIRTSAEDRLLDATFGDEFKAYRKSTPALIPRLF